ncbi:unnamed protein product [Linum trigynum]|uniref:Uncharacterized protein n=1 Tax=Linum trigynum TaxID=586398 RepID=A0AAV2DSV6_9ROSI
MAAASFSSKPYKWPRSSFRPSPSPNSSAAAAIPRPSPSSAAAPPSLCSAQISCGRAWRRIPPCAHLAPFNDSRYPIVVFNPPSSSESSLQVAKLWTAATLELRKAPISAPCKSIQTQRPTVHRGRRHREVEREIGNRRMVGRQGQGMGWGNGSE